MIETIRTFAVAVIIAWIVAPAQAQERPPWVQEKYGGQPCGDYPEVVAWLKAERGETRVFRGTGGSPYLFEIYTNPRTPTWSGVIVSVRGSDGEQPACIGAYGKKSSKNVPGNSGKTLSEMTPDELADTYNRATTDFFGNPK